MADVRPGTNREHILDLETDIQKSMKSGFPQLFFTRKLEQHFLADTLKARINRFFVMGIIAIFIYNLFLYGQRNAP